MNIAIIFAGGKGKRMENTEIPKQFVKIGNKPIIIHTIEKFEQSKLIDAIIVSTLPEWIEYLNNLLEQYNIKKVKAVVPGGETGQMSIYAALNTAYKLFPHDSIVLIHDGVRPFINEELIEENIKCVKSNGSAISSVYMIETVVIVDEKGQVDHIPDRSKCILAKAPQSFILDDIYKIHLKAQKDGIFDSIDSCSIMHRYGKKCSIVLTNHDNMKITTPKDIPIAESIYQKLSAKK